MPQMSKNIGYRARLGQSRRGASLHGADDPLTNPTPLFCPLWPPDNFHTISVQPHVVLTTTRQGHLSAQLRQGLRVRLRTTCQPASSRSGLDSRQGKLRLVPAASLCLLSQVFKCGPFHVTQFTCNPISENRGNVKGSVKEAPSDDN
jgi:hypothetical protein